MIYNRSFQLPESANLPAGFRNAEGGLYPNKNKRRGIYTKINEGKIRAAIFPNFKHMKLANTAIIVSNTNTVHKIQNII